jgi:membrane-bound metal-dependent hydrolase YbcI (DUF457 family)
MLCWMLCFRLHIDIAVASCNLHAMLLPLALFSPFSASVISSLRLRIPDAPLTRFLPSQLISMACLFGPSYYARWLRDDTATAVFPCTPRLLYVAPAWPFNEEEYRKAEPLLFKGSRDTATAFFASTPTALLHLHIISSAPLPVLLLSWLMCAFILCANDTATAAFPCTPRLLWPFNEEEYSTVQERRELCFII